MNRHIGPIRQAIQEYDQTGHYSKRTREYFFHRSDGYRLGSQWGKPDNVSYERAISNVCMDVKRCDLMGPDFWDKVVKENQRRQDEGEETFRGPFIALIQVLSNGGQIIVARTLGCNGILQGAWKEYFTNQRIVKLVIGGSQDLKAIQNTFGIRYSYLQGHMDIQKIWCYPELFGKKALGAADFFKFCSGLSFVGDESSIKAFKKKGQLSSWLPVFHQPKISMESYK